MRITDLLDKKKRDAGAAPSDKKRRSNRQFLSWCRAARSPTKKLTDSRFFAREEESTTGIGEGIAIPHGKCDAVTRPGLAAMVIPGGVDFDSLDGEPVTLLFLIAAPNTKDNVHLDVLSKLP